MVYESIHIFLCPFAHIKLKNFERIFLIGERAILFKTWMHWNTCNCNLTWSSRIDIRKFVNNMGHWNWYVHSIYKLVAIVYKEGDDRISSIFKRNSLYNFKYAWISIKHNSSRSYLKKKYAISSQGEIFYNSSYLTTLVPVHHADLHIIHTITNISFNMQPYPYLCYIVASHA